MPHVAAAKLTLIKMALREFDADGDGVWSSEERTVCPWSHAKSFRHLRLAGNITDIAAEVDTSRQYEVVIDAAGTTSSFEQSVNLTQTCGRLLVVSTPWDGMTLPGMSLCLREIDLIPSSFYGRTGPSRDVDTAAALLGANPDIARAIITHRFPLDAAEEAFRVAADRKAGAIKVVLEP